ncbi:MAG: FecR domain-containing protein [Proteobacteria bacterium]|nr:FecR domain-containing protein [Pseudomonadota bacterium]
MFTKSLAAAAAASAMIVLAAQPQAAPEHIGIAESVSDQVEGVLPGQQNILISGSKVFHDETIRTNAKSLAQMRFLDDSSLSIAPKSEVKLDKFVYDPSQHSGQVVLQATRGVFRFIAGAQDPKNYSIKTPAATIGVRGTIVNVAYDGSNLTVELEEGSAYITMPDGHVFDITTPGSGLVVSNTGTVSAPQKISGPTKDPFKIGWSKFYLASLKQQLASGLANSPKGAVVKTLSGILNGAVRSYGRDYANVITPPATSQFRDAGLTKAQIGQIFAGAFPSAPLGPKQQSASLTTPNAPSTAQTPSIRSAVQTALANIDPALTGTARTQAIQSALTQVTKDQIAIYGASAVPGVVQAAIGSGITGVDAIAGIVPAATTSGVGVSSAIADSIVAAVQAGASAFEVASTAIALGSTNGMSPSDIGTGLGIAAAILERGGNKPAADQIAQTVANEGFGNMAEAYAAAVLQNGGTKDVADLGTGNPQGVTAETGTAGTPDTTTTGTTGTGTMSLPPCANPSCT